MRRFAFGFGLFLLAGEATPQAASVRATVDADRIGDEDTVQLSITLQGGSEVMQVSVPQPALQNLRVVGGPSTSTQVSIVNGRISQSKVVTWVLQPTATGEARVGSLVIPLEGGAQSTEEIAIEVVPGRLKTRPQPRRRRLDPFGDDFFSDPFGRQRGARVEPKLFIRAVADHTSLRVGEPLLLTYYLYTQTSVSDIGFIDAPNYPGFWSEELDRDEKPLGELATVEGERYRRFPIIQRLLFPTRAGSLEIPAARMRIGIPRQSFFDNGANVERSVDSLTIEVEALPEAPGFKGAVGSFRASATLDKTSLELGDAATLRFEVEGTGNLKWIEEGPVVEIAETQVFPPRVQSDLKLTPRGASGRRTWEYVVVPETGGTVEVPPLAFVYFDPRSGRIERAETQPLRLEVRGGVATSARVAARGARGAPALRASLDPPGDLLPGTSARQIALAVALALALHGALWLAPQLGELRRRRTGRVAPRRNVKHALSALQRVGKDGSSKEAAAARIESTLHDLFGSLDDSAESSAGERAARALLEEVQFIRYAPQLGDYDDKIRELANRAADVVRRWA